MKRVTLALFCEFLVVLLTGVATSPQVNGQTEISTEKLVGALRTLNTAEYSYREETGRFAHLEEMLAFLRKTGDLSRSPIDFENSKPYELSITTSPSVVSEARRGKAPARARCVRALSIQRLEGSRPRLRRTRAPMQIEWSGGVAWGCTGMVRRSTRADTMGRRVGDDEIML
jgi:hypothetical protein